VVINDPQSLEAWRRHIRRVTRNSRLPAAVFALPQLAFEQNRTFSSLAAEYRGACGCAAGGLLMSATIVAWFYVRFAGGSGLVTVRMTDVVVLAALTACATVIGKLLGLFWARWRLFRLGVIVHGLVASA
jgi:hypothetical protein